jgi:hypothetical protein
MKKPLVHEQSPGSKYGIYTVCFTLIIHTTETKNEVRAELWTILSKEGGTEDYVFSDRAQRVIDTNALSDYLERYCYTLFNHLGGFFDASETILGRAYSNWLDGILGTVLESCGTAQLASQ